MGVKFSQLPVASSVAADDYIAVLDSSESILKRTPISHASSGTEYGLATTTAYGHTKIVDNLSQSSLTSGNALAARQGNVIANDMAVVELSSTAAHAHAVGDFFMLIGQFVKCTVAISVGDTITIGVNCQSTNIGAVLSQLNSNYSSIDNILGSTSIPSKIGTTVTGALTSLYNNAIRFTLGSVHVTGNFANNGGTKFHHSYGITFNNYPYIFITRIAGGYWAQLDVGVTGVTTSGCDIEVFNRSGAVRNGADFYVYVLAILWLSS